MAYLYPIFVKYKNYTLSDEYKLEYKTNRFQLYQLVDDELEKLDEKYKQVCQNRPFSLFIFFELIFFRELLITTLNKVAFVNL